MLRSLNKIMNFKLQGLDKEVGSCKDFIFDDKFWVIRYLEVDTSKWLPFGGKVLICPISLSEPNWEKHQFLANLTRVDIKGCPPLDEHQPISHLYEAELFKYYGYGIYWMDVGEWVCTDSPAESADASLYRSETKNKFENLHLHATNEIKGYDVHASGQNIGNIDDFILDDDNWTISYIVIDMRSWLPVGRKVLISHKCIEAVNWAEHSISVNVSAHEIKANPLFDLKRLIDLQSDSNLDKYYEISQDPEYLHEMRIRKVSI